MKNAPPGGSDHTQWGAWGSFSMAARGRAVQQEGADLQAENNLLVATSGAGEIMSLKRQLGVATQNMAEAYKSEKKAKRAFSIATGLYLGFAVASLAAHYLDSLPV